MNLGLTPSKPYLTVQGRTDLEEKEGSTRRTPPRPPEVTTSSLKMNKKAPELPDTVFTDSSPASEQTPSRRERSLKNLFHRRRRLAAAAKDTNPHRRAIGDHREETKPPWSQHRRPQNEQTRQRRTPPAKSNLLTRRNLILEAITTPDADPSDSHLVPLPKRPPEGGNRSDRRRKQPSSLFASLC
ncbi:unnamed protein product [Urochloa humidicola]